MALFIVLLGAALLILNGEDLIEDGDY